MAGASETSEPRVLGRYLLCEAIAAGGMASVHLGRLVGPGGFTRTVAIKRLHAQFAKDPDFVSMFLDEARLAARIKHPNVVPIIDVVAREGELFLVMDYVRGESLSRLRPRGCDEGEAMPTAVSVAIAVGMLCGLHAAHEARDERGDLLELVHRDVSPQNLIVGLDGVPRLVDFGIAKAVGRLQTTRDGQFKGKLPYMAPEQILRRPVDRRTDVYAASVVLWQLLTGRRPFEGDEASILYQILHEPVDPPSAFSPLVPRELDALVLRGMSRAPQARFATALEMAAALERAVAPATPMTVGAWVESVAGAELANRAGKVQMIERATPSGAEDGSSPLTIVPERRAPPATSEPEGREPLRSTRISEAAAAGEARRSTTATVRRALTVVGLLAIGWAAAAAMRPAEPEDAGAAARPEVPPAPAAARDEVSREATPAETAPASASASASAPGAAAKVTERAPAPPPSVAKAKPRARTGSAPRKAARTEPNYGF